MSTSSPPQIAAAVAHFRETLTNLQGSPLDPVETPWDSIESGVEKLLGCAFTLEKPEHHEVAFMVAATLAEKLARDLGAFWFPNRSLPQGAALGFPGALLVFSPFDAAVQALSRGKLAALDEIKSGISSALARAREAQGITEETGPGPADYQRLFDPGFVQFMCLDKTATQNLWERPVHETIRDIQGAFDRLPQGMPTESRDPMRDQIVGSLQGLDGAKPLLSQIGAAPQLVELLTLLHGATGRTGFAPAELWEDVLMPLLHIGAATTFPPLDDDEIETYRKGGDPLLMYIDTIPFSSPAGDEDGLLGVFSPDEVLLLTKDFGQSPSLRLARLPTAPLAPLLAKFDGPALREAITRWKALLAEKAGPRDAAVAGNDSTVSSEGQPSLLDVAVMLLTDLGHIVQKASGPDAHFVIRRAPEAEAASEPALLELARALTGPRIILAS